MENATKIPRKKHFWSSSMSLSWDKTTMPMINNDLQTNKNEITLQVFKVKNSERAGKVLMGASTDMEDMINLCNYYHIDICQFMRLPDGTHPVMMHRDELRRLKEAANGTSSIDEGYIDDTTAANQPPADTPTADVPTTIRYVDDKNVSQLLDIIQNQAEKIDTLYERIIELSDDNARMRSELSKPYQANPLATSIVADDSKIGQR